MNILGLISQLIGIKTLRLTKVKSENEVGSPPFYMRLGRLRIPGPSWSWAGKD